VDYKPKYCSAVAEPVITFYHDNVKVSESLHKLTRHLSF